MKKLYTLLGIIAIGAVIGLTVFGCKKDADDDDGGGSPPGKPTELPDEATKDQAIEKLKEIINHPNASAETIAAAQALKVQVEAMSDAEWTSGGAAKITAINNLVDKIPDKGTLFIINIPGSPNVNLIGILIVPTGTPETESAIENAIVAGASGPEGHVDLEGTTLVAELYSRGTTNRWTGSGTYTIYVLDNGWAQTVSKANVSFTGGAATVPVSALTAVK